MKSLTVIAKRDQILGSYNAYLDQIGVMDNPAVKQALAEATDPRFKDFFKLIMRPNNAKFTPASYAKACNIEQAEFNQWWQILKILLAFVLNFKLKLEPLKENQICYTQDRVTFTSSLASFRRTPSAFRFDRSHSGR